MEANRLQVLRQVLESTLRENGRIKSPTLIVDANPRSIGSDMKKIFMTIIATLLLASAGLLLGFDSIFQAEPDQIKAEEITNFINASDAVQEKPLEETSLKALIIKGKEIFQIGKLLPEEFREKFSSRAVGSKGEGAEAVHIFNFLNKAVGWDQKTWDSYIARVTLEFDEAGRVTDFYWDKPMLSADKVIDVEQLKIFLRYVREKDFHGMRNKGEQLFQEGRVLPQEYDRLLAKYLKNEKDGVVRYKFYSYVDPSPHVFDVHLDVNTQNREVVNFTGLEAW